jgi:hypothetical protein
MLLTEPVAFITEAELLAKLNKSSTTPIDEFTLYVQTACAMIRDRMGEVSPVEAQDLLEPRWGQRTVVLEHTPVISITSVTDSVTGLPIPEWAAPTEGWRLESVEGLLRHSLRWTNRAVVEYVAGRDPTPANYRMAALDLAAHLWKGSQQNSGGGRPQVGQEGSVVPGTTWALPYSVRQTLGLDKRPRRDVWVG